MFDVKNVGGRDPRREIGFGFDDVGLAFLVIFIFYLNGCDGSMVHVGPTFVGESEAGPAKGEAEAVSKIGRHVGVFVSQPRYFYFFIYVESGSRIFHFASGGLIVDAEIVYNCGSWIL